MDTLAGTAAAAALLSTLLEGFIENVLAGVDPLKSFLMPISLVLGVVLALVFGIDLVTPALSAVGTSLAAAPFAGVAGKVITGIILGRGANYVHGFVGQYLLPSGK